ncbi:hypothetical protein Ddye_017741 [Dipteronia dyeriana]|uniref:Mechanosensitive ion channel MscS domain-containing protein n=1 Tax=Dipteronia dyeriana TaxID=168575 RepID=A0AAD9X1E9_9ROSI|nr:hypothetical protein Ddye_017741 [Dipteronia dyeriana]
MKNPNHLKVEYVGPRSCVLSPKGPGDIDADAAKEQLPPKAIFSIYSVVCVACILKSMPRFLMVMRKTKSNGLLRGISFHKLVAFVLQLRLVVFFIFYLKRVEVTGAFLDLKPYYDKTKPYCDKKPDKMKESLNSFFFGGAAVSILFQYLVQLSYLNMVKEGNYIQGESVEGKVMKIGILRTKLLDSKNRVVIVRNSELETRGVMTV